MPIRHRHVLGFLDTVRERYDLAPGDVVSQAYELTFDRPAQRAVPTVINQVSPARRRTVLAAVRRGTVPDSGLDLPAVAEVQISETETPLHRLETVYRRLCQRLATAADPPSAFRPVLDSWFSALEEDVLAEGAVSPNDADGLGRAFATMCHRNVGVK